MSQVHRCDRCRVIEPNNKQMLSISAFRVPSVAPTVISQAFGEEQVELCIDCVNSLAKWWGEFKPPF